MILNLKWEDIDFARKTAIFRDTNNGETLTVPLSSILLSCLLDEKKKSVILSLYVFSRTSFMEKAEHGT